MHGERTGGKHEKRKVQIFEKYSVLILIATLLMSIGYAEITGIDMQVATNVETTAQKGVFITDITRTEYSGADISTSKINNYLDTTMNSTVVLGSDPGSYITYYVSIYNRSEREQVYIGPFGLTGEDLYDNSKITYEVQGITPYETVLEPGKNYNFTIKFKYTGNDTSDNTLTSRLNFRFMEKPELAITNEGEITGIYPGYAPQEYEFKVCNYNGETINNVALSYGLTAEIQKPFIAKIYDSTGVEVTSSTTIDVAGKNAETGAVSKVDHTYKLKIMWDSTNPETDVPYNNAEYAGQTYTAKINMVATPKANAEGINKYENYQLTNTKDITVKTAPLYFTAEQNNTTIEMTNNRAEINLAVSNNNGSAYNPYETKYTISQDNSKYTLYVDEVEYANNITGERTIGTGEKITLVEKIWLVPKDLNTIGKEETANITISITSPYTNKTETKEIKITDTTGPTAPTITGGSESFTTSQTISVSKVATDVGTGVKNYEYLVNNTGTAVADASGNVGSTEAETSKTFDTDYNGYYIWFRAVDKVGNKGEWSNSQKLNIETTAPTITLGTNENTTWSKEGSVTVKLQDTTSGLASGASIKYGWSTSLDTEPDSYTVATLPTYTDGTTTEVTFIASASGLTGKYYLWVVPTTLADTAGNTQTTTAKSTGQFYFDNQGPSAPTITGGSTSWAISRTISVSTAAVDEHVGRVASYEYYLGSTSTAPTASTAATGTASTTTTSQTFTTARNGYYVYFRGVDSLGNKGTWSSAQRLYIESTKPTITIKTNSNTTWAQTGSVTVALKDTTSGLASGASVKYGWSTSLDTAPGSYTTATIPTYTEGTTSEVTFTASASGLTGKYYLWVVPTTLADKAGNSQTTTAKSTGQFYFDNQGPSAPTITGGSTSWATSRTISVSTASTDSHVGTVSSYEYYLASNSTAPTASTTATGTASTTTTSQTFTTARNGYYVYFRGVDSLGNKGTWSSAQRLYIESTQPTITIKTNSNTTWAQTGSVTVALKDTTSGLASGASVKYGWSTSTSTAPSGYTTATIPTYTAGTTSEVTFTASASGLTGKYYLWVVPTTLADKAGNSQTATVKSTGQFYFDNQGPSAPTITGGSTTYATSRTISVSTASTDSHVGTVSKYEYYYTSSSTAPTASTSATGTVSTTTTSQTFASNMKAYYVYFRGVDSLGNKGTWSSAQRLYIDVNSPTVSANNSSVTITAGDNVAMSTYFTTSANGNAAISSTVYKIGSASYTNTSSLAAGTYTVTCTVTKVGGKTASASMTLTVKSALPTSRTILASAGGTVSKSFTVPAGVEVIELESNGDGCIYYMTSSGGIVSSPEAWGTNLYVRVTPGKVYYVTARI